MEFSEAAGMVSRPFHRRIHVRNKVSRIVRHPVCWQKQTISLLTTSCDRCRSSGFTVPNGECAVIGYGVQKPFPVRRHSRMTDASFPRQAGDYRIGVSPESAACRVKGYAAKTVADTVDSRRHVRSLCHAVIDALSVDAECGERLKPCGIGKKRRTQHLLLFQVVDIHIRLSVEDFKTFAGSGMKTLSSVQSGRTAHIQDRLPYLMS